MSGRKILIASSLLPHRCQMKMSLRRELSIWRWGMSQRAYLYPLPSLPLATFLGLLYLLIWLLLCWGCNAIRFRRRSISMSLHRDVTWTMYHVLLVLLNVSLIVSSMLVALEVQMQHWCYEAGLSEQYHHFWTLHPWGGTCVGEHARWRPYARSSPRM